MVMVMVNVILYSTFVTKSLMSWCACVVSLPPAFIAVTFYACKINTMDFVTLLQGRKVNFSDR